MNRKEVIIGLGGNETYDPSAIMAARGFTAKELSEFLSKNGVGPGDLVYLESTVEDDDLLTVMKSAAVTEYEAFLKMLVSVIREMGAFPYLVLEANGRQDEKAEIAKGVGVDTMEITR